MTKKRLAIIISHPIQHYVPVYKELSKQKSLEVKVFFLAENGLKPYQDEGFSQIVEWDLPMLDGYEHTFVEPGRVLSSFGFFKVDSVMLIKKLDEFSPDFIWIHGYGQRINWRVQRWAKAKLIYTSDSNLVETRSWWRKAFKQVMVRYFFSKIDYFIALSPRNKKYLKNYGVDECKISQSTFPIDMRRLISQRDSISIKQLSQLKQKLNIPAAAKVILYAGKLVDYKRPADLISAIEKLNTQNIVAVFVGSGAEEGLLKIMARKLNVEDKVCFAGFVNQSKMAEYLSLADIFVFPSAKEPYGAIASETLPFGLPIVASHVIGAIGSSILPNENALIYRAANTDAMAQCLLALLTDKALANKFSKRSVDTAHLHDVTNLTSLLCELCESP